MNQLLGAASVQTATLYVPRKNAGGYRVGIIQFMLPRKPSAWHRFWSHQLLGWVWEDER